MMRKAPSSWLTLASLMLAVLTTTGCERSAETARSTASARPGTYPYAITTTVGMVTDIVQRVAGEHATVTGLIQSGADPHLFKPSREHLIALEDADVIFYNGLHLEGKMTDVLVRMARSKPVYAVTERIDEQFLRELPDSDGYHDPHVWMDVDAWRQTLGVVADALAAFDPRHADDYRANAARFDAELVELDAYVRRVVASIPPEQRVLITAHDAFGYFGRAYELDVRGIQGVSTESEAGLQDINNLIDFIVERGVRAVFVETSVNEKYVAALVEGAQSRGHGLQIGGELFSDAMGPPNTYEGTYIGMLDHNATTIARALGGDAPVRGMQGRLSE